MNLKLVIGDKNLSSWSLRAWLAAKHSGLPFEEKLVWLDRSDTAAKIKAHSPSETVPCLIHDELTIWDSLAICEYISELAPTKNLWPKEMSLRATARAYASEMHSGFSSLRSQMSMDIRLRTDLRHLTDDTISDIERIREMWETALTKNGGPFLFGSFGIVDAFFAPVVFRFQSYGITFKSNAINAYMTSVLQFPFVKEWADEAVKEKALSIQF